MSEPSNHLDPIDGEVIKLSRMKLWGIFFLMLFAAIFGAFLVYVRWKEDVISITGIIFAIVGTLGSPLCLWAAIAMKKCLIIGKNKLQMGEDPSRIDTEIPYTNIEEIRLTKGKDFDPSYVTINLVDVDNPNTIMPGLKNTVETNRKLHGYDILLENFSLSAKELHRRLVEKWDPEPRPKKLPKRQED